MKVTLLTPADLIWPMGTQDNIPQYRCGTGRANRYTRTLKVDPYPAYHHNVELVESLVTQCVGAFPLKEAVTGLWVLSHDFSDRFNGITYEDSIYKREDGSEWVEEILCECGCGEKIKRYGQALTIALAGKRIPIMSSMTRYLVTHEYGHAVFHYIARKMGFPEHEIDKLAKQYMEIRGFKNYATDYNGGQWHMIPGEIIANDFRILFTKQEMEFYPHEIGLPMWGENEGKWWRKAVELCEVKI